MVNICYHVRHELQQKTVAKAKEKINISVEVVQKVARELGLEKFMEEVLPEK